MRKTSSGSFRRSLLLSPCLALVLRLQMPVAKLLPPIRIDCVAYSWWARLRHLNDAGESIGPFPREAEPMRLYGAPLVAANGLANLTKLDFFDVAVGYPSSLMRRRWSRAGE